jgi:hypothetical protein
MLCPQHGQAIAVLNRGLARRRDGPLRSRKVIRADLAVDDDRSVRCLRLLLAPRR